MGGYRLPVAVVVSPALDLVGLSEALHDDVGEFRPVRFLAGNPEPSTWIPFGGFPRPCVGAAFSLVESVEILRELPRAYETEPIRSRPERLRPLGIINAASSPLLASIGDTSGGGQGGKLLLVGRFVSGGQPWMCTEPGAGAIG